MKIEYEVKILDIDVNLIKNKLNELNAKKMGIFFKKDMFMILILKKKILGLDLEIMGK